MRTTLLYLLFVLLFTNTSCKKEKEDPKPEPEIIVPQGTQVGGKILLPQGTKLDTAGHVVLSAFKSVIPISSTYVIDTLRKFSTTLLLNKAGDLILMKYNYPGQKNGDISAESTALALIMNTPVVGSLTDKAKVELIPKIIANPIFLDLANEISARLKAGIYILSNDNPKISDALASLFKELVNKRVLAVSGIEDPISINTVNTELSLKTNDVSCSYAAGIYKDGKLTNSYMIKGRRRFANGLEDIWDAIYGEGYGSPEPVIHTMKGNGTYQIKLRSGRPGSNYGDAKKEHSDARLENVVIYAVEKIFNNLPIEKIKGCEEVFYKAIKTFIVAIYNQAAFDSEPTLKGFSFLVTDMAISALEEPERILGMCNGFPEETSRYMKAMNKILDFLNKIGKVADGMNTGDHVAYLFLSKPAIDTCFQVIGLRTYPCGEELPGFKQEYIDGNNQEGTPNVQLNNPLKVVIKDPEGRGTSDVEVTWVVSKGGGTLSSFKTLTNSQGMAEVKWTIGMGEQQVQAFVKRKNGKNIDGSPVNFTTSIKKDLANLILGKWKLVKEYGIDEEKPYEDVDNSHHLIFYNDGTNVVLDDNGNEDIYHYKIDEQSKILSIMDPTDQEWEYWEIKRLDDTDLIIYEEDLVNAEHTFLEYKRVEDTDGGRISAKIRNTKVNRIIKSGLRRFK
jgi:hypothetical protein